ncbi:AraC family transcriptional regulator [Ketobacter sp.]|uniref:AraC family transcriptional regulator n=1 Tax=Ketobacter sp. TaxID=2083498 RepID=UPI0025C0B20B|nr:AraC family transcriptional regulator [Ketobacter sp.]
MTTASMVGSPQHQSLIQGILKWADGQGMSESALPGLQLYRADEPTATCSSTVYDPSIAFLIQGGKTVQLGDREIVYDELTYLTTSVSLPVLGHVVEASPDRPYLAMKLVFSPQEIADLVLQAQLVDVPECDEASMCNCGLQVAHLEPDLLDALARLLGLLDRPQDIAVLGPLFRREVLYRVLMGELGLRMRKFAMVDHQASRVSRVIAILKDRFTEPLRVKELADAVNMSESALFRSFKDVTRMSPLQFQKRLRLYEARRLMLGEGLEAATASFRVGYESPSHFSREYSRLFGASPRSDVLRQRAEQLKSLG